jgi:hypothetical protein
MWKWSQLHFEQQVIHAGTEQAQRFQGARIRSHRTVFQSLQIINRPWLGRLMLVLGGVAALVLSAVNSSTLEPLEATVRMERLAAKAERARILPSETKGKIAWLMSQASYDCDQVVCQPQLSQRNRVARARLKALLSAAGAPQQESSMRDHLRLIRSSSD